MDVSIIIVNYNTPLLLFDCINSIVEHTKTINYEIIVVDNASADNSCEYIAANFPNVKLIRNIQNKGFGNANNDGASISKGDYLFFLNSDTVLISPAIEIFYYYMICNPKVGLCCGNLFKPDLQPNYSYNQSFPSLKEIFFYRLGFIKNSDIFNKTETIKPVLNVIGADMFVSRKLFFDIGRFDKDFFMYVEDTELSYRFFKAGYISVNIPDAKIIHLQGASSASRFKVQMEIDGFILFFRKHSTNNLLKFYLLIELLLSIFKSLFLLLSLKIEKFKVAFFSVKYVSKNIYKLWLL